MSLKKNKEKPKRKKQGETKNKMKPQSNLTKAEVKVFNQLVIDIEESGKKLSNVDSIELSMLAQNIQLLHDTIDSANGKYYNEFPNGTVQVNAYFTIKKETEKTILSIGSKYGLSLKDRKDIGKDEEQVEKPKGIDDFFPLKKTN